MDDAPLDPTLAGLLASTHLGTLATLRRDGRPQLSLVSHHFDPMTGVVRVSVTETRAKTKNLRRDPRATFFVHTPDGSGYVAADGTATLSAVASAPDDDAVEALVALYRDLAGEHPDWDDYRRAMVADQRVLLSIAVERLYGWVRPG